MFEANVEKIIRALGANDTVLDIGGWGRPFNRANWVMDAEAYETRGYYGKWSPAQAGSREYFTKDSWIQRDICDKSPFPFQDKQIDYVICSHTLEDVRDPLWVCSEMVRVGKRGYIEVPSRLAETCRGKIDGAVGWGHHRWLIDIVGSHVTFLMKYHTIHGSYRFCFPASVLRRLPEEKRVQWLFWDDSFSFEERTIHGVREVEQELERYVAGIRPYSAMRLNVTRTINVMKEQSRRVIRRVRQAAGFKPLP